MSANSVESEDRFFGGKVVIVYLINPPEEFKGGVAVIDPKIEERRGRTFLIGHVPSNPEDWTSGLRAGIAFDQVAHFLEFEDEKEFLERMSLATEARTFGSVQ